MQRRIRPIEARFWEKVQKTDSCWLWTGPIKANGYGVISRGRQADGYAYTHRLAWELEKGPIPAGQSVLHRCDVRNCVRASHLFLGTQAENMADMHRKGRGATADKTRHLGEANGRAVLDWDRVRLIRARHEQGESIASIARSLGVGETTVRNIVYRRRWRDELPRHMEASGL